MRALALLGVLFLVKLLVLAGRPIDLSFWSPVAYLWQDVLVVLVYASLDRLVKRAWFGWTLYVAVVAYVAINVPVTRVLSSPLTWRMLGAAGGALSDSIWHHATAANLALMSLVVVAAIVFPRLPRPEVKGQSVLIVAGLAVVFAGPVARTRVDTAGLDRNAIVAIAVTALPRYPAGAPSEPGTDWRKSPVDPSKRQGGLPRWRGSATNRNVVVVVLESAGAEYLRPYGATRDPMPRLTELSEASIIFDNAYAVYPESIKALFSVLCSRYPAIDTEAGLYETIAAPSLASELRSAGYRTALFHSGRFMYLGMESVVANRGYEVLEDAGAIGGNYESSFGVDEAATVERALNWIDSLSNGQRFLLTYLPIAGHHPYATPGPGPFRETSESDRYLNALHYADQSLGALIDGLRSRGLFESSLFVIFGDHGQAFGQHDGNYGHSLFIYEENVKVPYIVAAPGVIEQGVRVSEPISLIDTAPTILDLLGLPAPAEYQGRSALGEGEGMALFFTDYSLRMLGLRDGCRKFIFELDSGRSKLFDLCVDSGESKDLSAGQPEGVKAYRDHLLRWSAEQSALTRRDAEAGVQ
jgi:glucan phosphoethanolaminetransferase (alkaline phosphatase superfamily)